MSIKKTIPEPDGLFWGVHVRTAYRSPWQNPFVERFVGTLRRKIFDHIIILNQRHLDQLLKEFIDDCYHTARPHQGLEGDAPIPHRIPYEMRGPSKLISIPVLGGLHHRYQRVAAQHGVGRGSALSCSCLIFWGENLQAVDTSVLSLSH